MEFLIAMAALVLLTLLAASLLTPGHSGTGEPAHRIRCASRLRQVGQASYIYAAANGGRFPDSVERIYLTQDLTAAEFVCPTSGHTPAQGSTRAEVAAQLAAGKHLSYVYVGAGMTSGVHPDTVVMYDDPAHHGGDGAPVLFGDMRVEWLPARELRRVTDLLAAGKGPVVLGRNPLDQLTTTVPATQSTQPSHPK